MIPLKKSSHPRISTFHQKTQTTTLSFSNKNPSTVCSATITSIMCFYEVFYPSEILSINSPPMSQKVPPSPGCHNSRWSWWMDPAFARHPPLRSLENVDRSRLKVIVDWEVSHSAGLVGWWKKHQWNTGVCLLKWSQSWGVSWFHADIFTISRWF